MDCLFCMKEYRRRDVCHTKIKIQYSNISKYANKYNQFSVTPHLVTVTESLF